MIKRIVVAGAVLGLATAMSGNPDAAEPLPNAQEVGGLFESGSSSPDWRDVLVDVPDMLDEQGKPEVHSARSDNSSAHHGRRIRHLKKRRVVSSGGVAKGDFNGDGVADLAIGVPLEDVPVLTRDRNDAGAVIVVYGGSSGLTAAGGSVPASQLWHQDVGGVLDAVEGNDRFGAALAAGDFNGDGRSDLAIGVPGEPNASGATVGAVQVLYGSATGLTASGNQFFLASDSGTRFPSSGLSMVWADFNGDGFGDLAVEAVGPSNSGAVLVLPGSASGLTRTGSQLLNLPNDVGFFTEISFFTDLVLAAGDFNRDGRAELVVGAPFGFAGALEAAGDVRLLFGTPTGLTQTGSQVFHQNTSGVREVAARNDRFGAALAAGDFNGDHFLDLAVGVPGEDNGFRLFETPNVLSPNSIANGGAVNILFGNSAGLTGAGGQMLFEAKWLGVEGPLFDDPDVEPGDGIGSSLASGDFNGDGISDLAIGAPGETLGTAANAGSVSVFYGSGGGLENTQSLVGQFWTESIADLGAVPAAGDRFGFSLTAWNFGRNHNIAGRTTLLTSTDLAIGIPGKDVSGIVDAGAVRVVYGIDIGLATSASAYNAGPITRPQPGPSQLWHQDVAGVPDQCEANDQFGLGLY